MIPLKLQLKNFLSYGAEIQTIDFQPYSLICLSGKNGHGKSALLDAITWALWGQARKLQGAAKSDESILRLGQTHAMVCMDFEFNEQLYRVKREFALTHGKPYAALEIGIIHPEKGIFQALTEKKIRDTQEKINDILGLTYESFINSAFLRQGQANEFSKKTAKERKEILSTILGLDTYEKLRKRAMEKSRLAIDEKQQYEKLQERMKSDLEQEAEINLQLKNLEDHLITLDITQKKYTQTSQELLLQQRKVDQKKQEYDQKKSHLEQIKKNIENHKNQIFINISNWRKKHHQLLKLSNKKELEESRKIISAQLKIEQEKLKKLYRIKDQLFLIKEREQQVMLAITHEHTQELQNYIFEIEKNSIENKNLNQQLTQLKDQLKKIDNELSKNKIIYLQLNKEQEKREIQKKNLQKEQIQFDRRRNFYQAHTRIRTSLLSELDGLQQKRNLIHDETNPSCPLCEQNLSASRKRFLHEQFDKQEQFFNHRIKRITKILNKLKEVLVEQHAHIEKIKDIDQEYVKTSSLLEQLQNNEKRNDQEHENIIQEIKTLEKAIEIVHKKIEENNELSRIQKEKVELETDIAQAEKAMQTHETLSSQLEMIERNLELHEKAQEEYDLQKSLKENIENGIRILKTLSIEYKKLFQELPNSEEISQELKLVEKKEIELKIEMSKIQQEKESAYQQKGSLSAQKIKLSQMKKEFSNNEQKIKKLFEQSDEYNEIAKALSKDGIQALLIEEVIPEIEQEANDLLARLTDNQSHLFIESIRDLKKGGSRETLDIKISDPSGLRAYELFSGGEAFRIDFALRIAISKLLARRAGASLQTLIIDEGFGSQDEEGLGHIMDLIHKIRDDFAKIIIVSHLPSMKDQFPVQFEVQKSAQGTTISVIEQG